MFVIFVDESGVVYSTYDKCRKRKRSALLVVGALGIQESQLGMVDQWFTAMKGSYLGNAGRLAPQAYEIKGSILYSLRCGQTPQEWLPHSRKRSYTADQQKIWGRLSPSRLLSLEQSVFDLLRRIQPVSWAVVVKQDRLYSQYQDRTWHPFYWALTYLQQRVVLFVQARFGTYERGLVVLDENSTLRQASQFDEFLHIRKRINDRTSWPADFGSYLVDVPLFGQSHLHQALQLADMVAHSVWRHVNKTDPLGWFDQLEPFLARHWSTGSIDHAGLTFIQ
jgi:hypothetical protein